MASLNKMLLIGNLGRDPEVRETQSGKTVCNFSLATTEKWDGGEQTTWHRVIAWGRLAEVYGQYLKKGAQVYVEGRVQYRQWEDKDGNRRDTTEVVASQMTMLGKKDADQGGGEYVPPERNSDYDGDLPF